MQKKVKKYDKACLLDLFYKFAIFSVFFLFLQQYEYVKLECQGLIHQAKDLQMKLDMQTQQTISFEQKLNHARKLLENERKARREAEAERDAIYQKMSQLREVIDQDHTVRDETKKQFAVLNNYTKKRKSIIREEVANEINSTGSFLSDLSLTQSEDDFLESKLSTHQQKWKKHRPSYNNNNQSFLNASGKKARMSTEKRRSARRKFKILSNFLISELLFFLQKVCWNLDQMTRLLLTPRFPFHTIKEARFVPSQ